MATRAPSVSFSGFPEPWSNTDSGALYGSGRPPTDPPTDRRRQDMDNDRKRTGGWMRATTAAALLAAVVWGCGKADDRKTSPHPDRNPNPSNAPKTVTLPGGATMEFVWCPPGSFTMGSPESENGRNEDEMPHQVTLTEGFWLAKTEVTQKQWTSVMGNNPSEYKGDDLPVENVNWNDCMEFCKKAGLGLPTEAQWEYACRAGSKWPFAGTGNPHEMCWLAGDPDESPSGTHPVARKRPNAWGLFDMHGNVSEWCADGYRKRLGSQAVTDPKPRLDECYRVCRGGSWRWGASRCRSASRNRYDPDSRQFNFGRFYDLGFRPVIPPNETVAPANAVDSGENVVPGISGESPVPEAELRPGATKTVTLPGGALMQMAWCPPGTFMMGSPEGEEGREEGETLHRVTLTHGFWMAKTEVTQRQWESVMGNNPSDKEGDDLPVNRVDWQECREFCRKAGMSLPTEAQWEYACRAGSEGAFGGTGDLWDMGWHDENCGNGPRPVGRRMPNAWGLFDMHGNVAEWCLDCIGEYPSGSVTDPKNLSGSVRCVRGGSHVQTPSMCRSAKRGAELCASAFVGFRPVMSASSGNGATIPLDAAGELASQDPLALDWLGQTLPGSVSATIDKDGALVHQIERRNLATEWSEVVQVVATPVTRRVVRVIWIVVPDNASQAFIARVGFESFLSQAWGGGVVKSAQVKDGGRTKIIHSLDGRLAVLGERPVSGTTVVFLSLSEPGLEELMTAERQRGGNALENR